MNKIWITWEDQRRNREISSALNVTLYEFPEIDRIANLIRKYMLGIWQTLKVLWREKPAVVFAQNPSIVLSFLVVLLRCLFRYQVIIDAHNVGLFPAEGKSKFLNWISRYIQRKAHMTIVTNKALKTQVETNKGRAFVLPDKIPDFPSVPAQKLNGKENILFICTYASDEPYQEVFRAAGQLKEEVTVYVSGNYRKANIKSSDLPPNIVLTGYLSEKEYISMLSAVDATIDLTTRENCLVCGAYESIAMEKPMILSNTAALKKFFQPGAVFEDNNSHSLYHAILQVLKNKENLTQKIREMKYQKIAEWEALKKNLLDLINIEVS
jgi:glycosyltransferase involved in cell wall biosynthesis